MGNIVNLPNITPESIVLDGDTKTNNIKTGNFDVKNYLNTKLKDGETEKILTIRLLPMDLETGNPFVKVHVHNVQVAPGVVKPGEKPYKSYICLSKNKNIDHEKYGNACPYCELNQAAYIESTQTTDPIQKQELQRMSLANKANEAVIVRCIERGKEDEGVKFWKFNLRKDKTDPYNQILELYKQRKESAERKGKVENILDLYNGRDLIVTIKGGGTSAPTIVDDSDRSPLSESDELMKEWIYDKKKWQDVFTCKPYDYLNLVSQMRVPWYDRKTNSWIDKQDAESNQKSSVEEANDTIEKAENEINMMMSSNNSVEGTKVGTEVKNDDFISAITVADDELPF